MKTFYEDLSQFSKKEQFRKTQLFEETVRKDKLMHVLLVATFRNNLNSYVVHNFDKQKAGKVNGTLM